jgi:phosphoribosylformylglycinamidine synthase subunit PurS
MGTETVQTTRARTVRIVVTLKPGVLDAPGQAIRQGLDALGLSGVQSVRAGKYFEVELTDDGRLDERVRQMCQAFLANTLIEEFRYDIL